MSFRSYACWSTVSSFYSILFCSALSYNRPIGYGAINPSSATNTLLHQDPDDCVQIPTRASGHANGTVHIGNAYAVGDMTLTGLGLVHHLYRLCNLHGSRIVETLVRSYFAYPPLERYTDVQNVLIRALAIFTKRGKLAVETPHSNIRPVSFHTYVYSPRDALERMSRDKTAMAAYCVEYDAMGNKDRGSTRRQPRNYYSGRSLTSELEKEKVVSEAEATTRRLAEVEAEARRSEQLAVQQTPAVVEEEEEESETPADTVPKKAKPKPKPKAKRTLRKKKKAPVSDDEEEEGEVEEEEEEESESVSSSEDSASESEPQRRKARGRKPVRKGGRRKVTVSKSKSSKSGSEKKSGPSRSPESKSKPEKKKPRPATPKAGANTAS